MLVKHRHVEDVGHVVGKSLHPEKLFTRVLA